MITDLLVIAPWWFFPVCLVVAGLAIQAVITKRGLLIAWIAVALFGLDLVGWAYWFHCRGGSSFFALPEIVGFVGIYVAFQGIANARRIIKKTPPREEN